MATAKKISELAAEDNLALYNASLKDVNFRVFRGVLTANNFDGSLILLQQNSLDSNSFSLTMNYLGTGLRTLVCSENIFNNYLFNYKISVSGVGLLIPGDVLTMGALFYSDVNTLIFNTATYDIVNGTTALTDVIAGTQIEIYAYQYGDPFNIVSAETNASGDQITITLSEEVGGYFLEDPGVVSFSFSDGKNLINIAKYSNTQIILYLDTQYTNSDTITLTYDNTASASLGGLQILSKNYGKLNSETDFPVTNNVPA